MTRRDASTIWKRASAECEAALTRGEAYVLLLRDGDLIAEPDLLSPEECAKAARYRRPQDAGSFILGRTALHRMLHPARPRAPWSIELGEFGKPRISGAPPFNLSHAWPYLALAVCVRSQLGVDVELLENCLAPGPLFNEILHHSELRYMRSVDPSLQAREFMRCWTRKEALLKAHGSGLSRSLQSIDTHLDREQPVITLPPSLRVWDIHTADDCGVSVALDPDVKAVTTSYVEIRSVGGAPDTTSGAGTFSWRTSVATIRPK